MAEVVCLYVCLFVSPRGIRSRVYHRANLRDCCDDDDDDSIKHIKTFFML